MKKLSEKNKKTAAIALTVCLAAGTVCGVAYGAPGIAESTEAALAAAREANAAANTALGTLSGENGVQAAAVSSAKAEDGVSKSETVYVIAGADGAVEKVIVNDELKNAGAEKTLTDVSGLSDITNVKGLESYTTNPDGSITWDAQGKDICYQGVSDRALPVSVSVSYALEGKTVSPAELAGKSGRVSIRFDYDYNSEAVNSDTTVPFLALTGVVLDDDSFSNIEISNGKIIDDGDRSVVIGFALPGMEKDLAVSGKGVDIPDYVEISADADSFALDASITYVTCDFANQINTDELNSIDDLTGALDQASSAVTQLMDGSSQLYDGLSTLLEKSGEFTGGIDTLYSGATALSSGLSTLDSNSASLNAGAYQVFSTLTASAGSQLNAALTAAGMGTVNLTPDNYSAVLGGLLDQISGGAYTQAEAAAREKIEPQVRAAVEAKVTEGVKETVKATVIEKGGTEEQAEMYLESVEGQMTVNTYVQQKMQSDEIVTTIASNVDQQLATAEVQAAMAAAVDSGLESSDSYMQIKGLKASLDSYAAFYSGLGAYTAGVSNAAKGAAQVTGGIGSLQSGGTQLVGGIQELKDGAMQLSDGVKEFYGAITSKLSGLSDGELGKIIPSLRNMFNAAKAYTNYSGIADGADGSVRFIIKTASV